MKFNQLNINFMGMGRIALILSSVLFVISVVSLFVRGLEFGIDFTGGTLIEVVYSESADLSSIRDALQQGGYSDAQVQHFGATTDVMIRLAPRAGLNSAQVSDNILQLLRAGGQEVRLQRVEFVGPQVGEELATQGLLAVLWVIGGILVYIWFRFSGWQLAVNCVIALVHDVVITLGFFSVFGLEFDLTVLAAIMALAGYSLNDTIVVFDRIRENFLRMRKTSPWDVMNAAINQTLSRTIITSGTTLAVVVVLYFFGGDTLRGFSLALSIGIVFGTYSSIFVASYLALLMGVDKSTFIVPEKEGGELDRP
ncbi:MAG TPA: protein translocase subunit SecF [Gammaproteobacteria bacterium]|nr:protein translocase subunit SecF [Gammaproteobacteria bacterium]